MHYDDLLERIRNRDAEAFLDLTDRYGWAVYSALREKYRDPEMADKIYNETMHAFYHSLSDSGAEDPVEAFLLTLADRITPERLLYEQQRPGAGKARLNLASYFGDYTSQSLEELPQKRICFWDCLAVLILVPVLTFCLWILAGFLMKMEILPFVDLGYSWLDTLVIRFLS